MRFCNISISRRINFLPKELSADEDNKLVEELDNYIWFFVSSWIGNNWSRIVLLKDNRGMVSLDIKDEDDDSDSNCNKEEDLVDSNNDDGIKDR